MAKVRYHVQLDSHRTTVTLDQIISELMAIKLNTTPGSAEAHAAVRKQIDVFIERDRGRAGYGLARYVTEQAVLFISDTMLSKKYWQHLESELFDTPD